MSDYWFPWYPSLYRLDTLHLTAEQDGVYRRLIDHYMETARHLPDNIDAIARIAGVQSDSDALRIAMAFFTHESGIGYSHKKCDSTLADMYERSIKRHGAAKTASMARWKKSNKKQKQKCDSDAIRMRDGIRSDATPTLTPKDLKTIVQLPEWVPVDSWNAYLKVRSKKSNNPDTLLMVIEQLAKWRSIGHDVKAILDNSAMNGYQGIFEPKNGPKAKQPEVKKNVVTL